MNIEAEIEKIDYSPRLCAPLTTFSLDDLKTGIAFKRSSFLLQYSAGKSFAISQWRSPKRTRTYPYARVYDTLNVDNRVTIIPFVKDEGRDGDRDFIQWDTISLMSLLKVHVILAYYKSATRSSRYPNKITSQMFDTDYLLERLNALAKFNQSDATHWNLNEIEQQLPTVAEQAKLHYRNIALRTGVELHGLRELDTRIQNLRKDVASYKSYSRVRAESARQRESQTTHGLERLTGQKEVITIKNFIGGYYFWTVDEALRTGDQILLVEKKHTSRSILPSLGDVKDAFLRMVLFTNLTQVTVEGRIYKPYAAVGLTSDYLKGYCHSNMRASELEKFFESNALKSRARLLISKIFSEGEANNFMILVGQPSIRIEQIVKLR